MFSHILNPIDGSETAFQVAIFAIKFARDNNARISLLYVENERNLQNISGLTGKKYDELVNQFRNQGRVFLQAIRTQVSKEMPNVDITDVIRVGEPATEIMNYAEENNVDLIIMPTKDADHSIKFNIGHITERVIQLTSIPVMAIPYKYITNNSV